MAMIEDSVVFFSSSALRYQEVSKMMGESLFMMTNVCLRAVRALPEFLNQPSQPDPLH